MKKLKTIHICQIAILLSVLSIAVGIFASYWTYKETQYQLFKFQLEMQSEKNTAMMSEYEDLQLQLNEIIKRCQLRDY